VLLVDLPGFGKSAKPEDFSYSMEAQAEMLHDMLTAFPCKKLHIVAHSMGGAVGLLLARKIPDRIKSFTNIEGNLVGEDCGALSRGIASLSYDEYRDGLFRHQIMEFKGHHQLRFEETTPYAVYQSAVSLVHWSDSGELYELFRELHTRKSYFYGEENRDMPIVEKMDFAGKYMISKSGHGMTTENPEEFYEKLSGFINRE
jgi:pimeloyl-ACP methyl ester carboxylesterase